MKQAPSLNALSASLASNRRQQPRTNIALKVNRYFLEGDVKDHYVEGIDLNSDENNVIKIFLKPDTRDIDLVANPELKRYEIADYANKEEQSSYVADSNDPESGAGVLLFSNCEKTGKDQFSSTWVSSGIHNSKNSNERLDRAYCSVDLFPPRIDGSRPHTAQIRMLLGSESEGFAAGDIDGFKAKIMQHMVQTPGEGYFIPEILIRLIDMSNPDATNGKPLTLAATLRAPTKSAGENEIPVYCTPEECMQIFLNPSSSNPNHKDLQSIIAFCSDPAIASQPIEKFAVEIIPVIRRNFGPETAKDFFEIKERIVDNKTVQEYGLSPSGQLLRDRFNMKTVEMVDDEEQIRSHRMFAPAFFVTNKLKDDNIDYMFVTKVQTLDVWPKGFKEHEVPTPFFKEYIADERDYLCRIRTEEAAMSPDQLALKAAREAKKEAQATKSAVTETITEPTQNVAEKTSPVASQTTTNQKPVAPQTKSETQVVEKPVIEKPQVEKPTVNQQQAPVASQTNDFDSDFNDEISPEHLESIEALFGEPQAPTPGM